MRERRASGGGRRAIPVVLIGALLAATLTAVGVPLSASADPPTGGSPIVDETFTGAFAADPAWTNPG